VPGLSRWVRGGPEWVRMGQNGPKMAHFDPFGTPPDPRSGVPGAMGPAGPWEALLSRYGPYPLDIQFGYGPF